MNSIIKLIIAAAVGGTIAFVKVQHSQAAHEKTAAKLQMATTNQVLAALGQPYRQMDAASFDARANAMAQDGFPISNADVAARGDVWLYFDSEVKNTGVRRYMTIFFDQTNHLVARVETTYWMKTP